MEKEIDKTGEVGKTGGKGEKMENRLRLWCSSLSPKISLVLISCMLTVFAGLSLYMAVSSVYGSGSRQPDIQHIRAIKIKSGNDSIRSINFQKIYDDDDFDE